MLFVFFNDCDGVQEEAFWSFFYELRESVFVFPISEPLCDMRKFLFLTKTILIFGKIDFILVSKKKKKIKVNFIIIDLWDDWV